METLIKGFAIALLLVNVDIHIPGERADHGEAFGRIIMQAGMRLQEAAGKRPLRFKAMNDSLSRTARAAKGMASGQDSAWILQELEEARREYDGNSFALLLMAVVENADGRQNEANRLFQNYLFQSRTYTELDKAFLSWDDFHRLRRIVYEMLLSRGVDFEGREKDIQVRIPFEALMEYVRNPSVEDQVWNLFLVGVILIGTVLILGGTLMGVNFSAFFSQSFVYLYALAWLCYGLWIVDLAVGLPFGWSRFKALPVLLGLFVFGRALQGGVMVWRERTRPLEEGYQRCPHCRAVIEKLMLECSKCRRRIET